MKKPVAVLLVVVLIVIGVPVLMPGMSAAACADCGPAVAHAPLCLVAVLVGAALALTLVSRSLREHRRRHLELLRAVFFDRPPQLLAV